MAFDGTYTDACGQSLYLTAQRVSDGYYWSHGATAWQSAPTTANQKITLTEGSTPYAGVYSWSEAGMGDAGLVRLFVHRTSDDVVIAQAEAFVYNGERMEADDLAINANVNDASATTTGFIGSANLSSTNDFYNNLCLVFTSGALRGLVRKIDDYVGATKTFTLAAALPSAPANGDKFKILGRAA